MSRPKVPSFNPFRSLLGRFTSLAIQRIGASGAFLAEPGAPEDAPTVLLLGPEIPANAKVGDCLSVFVTMDSEGRPLATSPSANAGW